MQNSLYGSDILDNNCEQSKDHRITEVGCRVLKTSKRQPLHWETKSVWTTCQKIVFEENLDY